VAVSPRDWARAAAGGFVVVGARAAAWSPVPSLAAVVVLDAHEEAYREERVPAWSAWQVAAERAARTGVPCVLVSPCPTVDQLAWGPVLAPSRAAERAGWPVVEVVDRRREDPRAGLYSGRLVNLLRSGGRMVCVLNRKGRARLLACGGCSELARCERCNTAVEPSTEKGTVRCRSCGLGRPAVCQACGSSRLRLIRPGVTRVREELEALAGRDVGEVTGESTELPKAEVLVGTEAVLHRVASAGTVAFLDFDQELLAPRFRAGEQALALLARAARLVGGRGAGRILVQTRLPHSEVLRAAVHADPGRFAVAESARRAELRLPPAAALAVVSGDGVEFVAALPATVEVLGPSDGRWLLRAPDSAVLARALAATPRHGARLRVEVDPPRA
jgi:primosomal protein N' (replication factor Y)